MATRVLFVTPYYVPFVGGTTAFLEAMARRLRADGWQVTILTTTARCAADFWQPSPESPPPPHEIVDGVEIERLSLAYPRPVPYAFGLLRRAGHLLGRSRLPAAMQRPLLRRLARAMPPLHGLQDALARLVPETDLVQVEDGSWDGLFTAAFEAARAHAKPVVARPLMHLGNAAVRAHFQMAHQVDAYRGVDAILALSQHEAAEYLRLGVPDARLHAISMGIDTPFLVACDQNRRIDSPGGSGAPSGAAAFRQQHNLQGPVVAFLGANTYDKGAFTLALAAAQLGPALVHVVYAGPGDAGLRAFIARQDDRVRRSLEARLHILGLVDEATKQQLLAACDMLALPSQVDTFGIVFLEAWAYARPVIGAWAGGIPDLVRDGQDGLLVPFGDAPALARAIEQLVGDPALAARLGAAGQARVLRDFTWDRTYRTLLDVYEALLHARQ